MFRIALKVCICVGLLPIGILTGAIVGALIAQVCYAMTPHFMEHLFFGKPSLTWVTNHPLLGVTFAGAFYFGVFGLVFSMLLGPVGLIFKLPREMIRQIGIAGLLIIACALFVGIAMSIYVALSKQKISVFHHVVTSMLPTGNILSLLPPLYMFYGTMIGAVFGAILAAMNMVRARYSGQSLKEYLLEGNFAIAMLISLVYPPNGLKIILLLAVAISFFLDWRLLSESPLTWTY